MRSNPGHVAIDLTIPVRIKLCKFSLCLSEALLQPLLDRVLQLDELVPQPVELHLLNLRNRREALTKRKRAAFLVRLSFCVSQACLGKFSCA